MTRSLLATCLLLAITLFANAQTKSIQPAAYLNYHLGWDGTSSLLKVSLDYTPATKDSTVFIYGDLKFGGQKEIFKVLQNIETTDKIKLTPTERKITVYHTDGGPKKISYTINGQLVGNPKRATLDELFRPLITPNLLYLVPQFFMINPVGHPAAAATIQWDSFPPGLPYFISTAAGTAPNVKQSIPLNKQQDVLILMGADLIIDTYKVHGIPYYAITSKADTLNNLKADLEPFFKDYFPGLRNFWKDDNAPYYYISVLPLLSIDKPWATGYSQKHGFVMRYSGKFDNNKKRVLAHETSHAWIGNSMQIGNDEFDNQWFGEGFNDYVTMINLVSSGIQDKAAFLDYVNNDNLLAHYSSKVKNAPNDSIAAKFWVDKNYQTLPYKRGFIYAFYFDNQIRLASGGKRSIRDFLLALFKINQQIHTANPTANLTLNDYIKTASRFIPEKKVRHQLQTNLIAGNALDFKKIKLISGFKIDYRDSIPVLMISRTTNLRKIYSK
ncbi:M1 family aminopeptidase [Mucilaginibacter sp.]|uniref:M1 family aminopeptidase n=1 Tax=Mucilaginibacter sp. TaxID=1882438 RepID=UPI0032640ED6